MNIISSLEPTDLPTAFQIEKHAHAFPWSEKIFASNQSDRYLSFRLRVDDVIVVFAVTQVVLDETTLFDIATDPNFQRQGLGREPLEHLIDELGRRGILIPRPEVRTLNVAAIVLYESLGFNEAMIRRNHYSTADGHEGTIIMALSVNM